MTRRKRKALLSAVICSALIGTGSFMTYAAGILQQSDADTLSSSLESSDQTYTQSYRRDDASPTLPTSHTYSTAQVQGRNAPITIGNANTASHSLTLKADLSREEYQNRAANVLSDAASGKATITNLQSLNLDLSGVHEASAISIPLHANLLTINGGTITVDSSVQTLNAVATRNMPHLGEDSNITARYSGTINIFSSNVNLATEGGYNSVSVNSDSRSDTGKTTINLGDDAHQLESITITHRTRPDDAANSPTMDPSIGRGAITHYGIQASANYDAAEETTVGVNTKRLDITNMTIGLRANGASKNGPKGFIRINKSADKADYIHIQASDADISSIQHGVNEIYGKQIVLETGSPRTALRVPYSVAVESIYGGRTTIGTGSGTGEGLILRGTRAPSTWGLLSRLDPNSLIDVTSGNVYIDRYNYAVQAENGTIRLGSAASPVNDVAIHNSDEGLRALALGNIEVNSRNLDIHNDVDTPVWIEGRGAIDIHTSGAATIERNSGNAITNAGRMTVNTGANDGATKLTGIVLTQLRPEATTDLSFHTSDSKFYGNAFDQRGKTTVTVSNGADWTLNPTVTRFGASTIIDTLHLSNNGTVNLGGNGTETGTSSRHTDMRVAHLDGSGGTFVFRTNLQESASARTVNGHSDQLTISETSSGTHNIMIYDHSYPRGSTPAVTSGYVLLVKDQSARPGAAFRGSANLQNGGLYAHPVEITNRPPATELGYTDVPTEGMNWYAHLVSDPSGPVPVIPTPTPNAENNMTFSRSRYGALWIEQETLRQRLGELRDHKQDDGIWARITRGEYTMNGVSGNADYTMYHIGYDKKIGNQKGHKQYVGMAYHHTDTDLNYRHFTDDSDMDADIGTIYYTNLGDKGHYLDIVGKFGRMKGKMKTFGEFPESAKWDSPFYSLSAEYGRKILYNNGWYWEPQAQLTYSHLGSDNYLTSQGTHAHVDNINSLIFRTGFTVGKKNGRNEYYGKVFWHHEFEGAEDAYFHDKNDFRLHDSYDFGSSWVTVGLGGQVGLSKDAYLYGDVEKSFGGDVKKKWAWNIGVRFGF